MTQQCRVCGCSNLSSCPGGCWWVEDDLCSSCLGPAETISCSACGQTCTLVNRNPGFGQAAYEHPNGPRCPMDR